jgi:hypothetical protein
MKSYTYRVELEDTTVWAVDLIEREPPGGDDTETPTRCAHTHDMFAR